MLNLRVLGTLAKLLLNVTLSVLASPSVVLPFTSKLPRTVTFELIPPMDIAAA